MGLETELKFRVPADKLASLADPRVRGARVGLKSERDLVSTYFDTSKHKLHRKGLSLRVRAFEDKRIQTIKATSSNHLGRGEWESEVKGRTPDLDKSEGTPLESLACKKLRRKLKPVFQTTVHRTTVPMRIKHSEVELAIDHGKIFAGGKSRPIAEIELELKKGNTSDLFRLAKAIGPPSQAELDLRSKAQMGYGLSRSDEAQPVYAERIEISANSTAGNAFQIIAMATVRHFSGNADAVRALQSEGVHQMRVGLRRLRAAISFFADLLLQDNANHLHTEHLKAELKWLTGELGPAREMDVFVKEMIEPAARDKTTKRGGRALARDFASRRAAAFDRAKRAVDSARFRHLLLDVVEWIDLLDNRTDAARAPIVKFGPAIMHRRIKKARKQGRRLDELTPDARHKLRIKIKTIRYGIGFFESLFTSRKARHELSDLSDRLKRIQSALGTLNDFIAHRGLATKAALRAPPADRRARAFTSGILLGKEQKAAQLLMKSASKAVHQLRPLGADLR